MGITGCKNTFCFSFNDNKFENDELSNIKSNILKDVIGFVHKILLSFKQQNLISKRFVKSSMFSFLFFDKIDTF